LILTKPIGMGIIGAGIKSEVLSQEDEIVQKACLIMQTLNKIASELMQEIGVSSCTDITGFGLLGHGHEMANGSNKALIINASKVPILDGVIDLAKSGNIKSGSMVNREFLTDSVIFKDDILTEIKDILFDPQTSGGLLISVERKKAELLLYNLHSAGVIEASIIGEVLEEPVGKVIVTDI